MVFKKLHSTGPIVEYLSRVLTDHLKKKERVTWLVCGGSAIDIAAGVSQVLTEQKVDVSQLVVTLTDERYGEPGHKDSNWWQLEQAGFALSKDAMLVPVLAGKDMEQTVADFASTLETALQDADYRIALFGIGADAHIAGIKPESAAILTEELAVGYAADYQRITMTFPAIELLDEAVVYSRGEAKLIPLKSLQRDFAVKPVREQPLQVLRQLKKVTVFNDQIGEKV
jgi:6-phosphogluconolactonase/glucosamine-6-phosphate isomerase/deaminase